MIAKLTSKGQLTLPKTIRDALHLGVGSKLDFKMNGDGTLTVRPLNRSIDSLVGLLHRPGMKPLSVAEIDAAIGEHLAAEDRRIVRQARARSTRPARKAA